ncbi:serine hydrolase [Cupriavidus consociatus]|uniref:serine hydrolase n=1 Tax=Cupriavidus consociatus TaxID=2821357 RepID=UPI001AE3EF77|nr:MULTISPECIES: serine hydrolase [unclassified Cupriavidus]MBP0625188.1 serine hydrolase [Cupriavidus sp. LEh25]MDK2661928.1 serine hydrolase [Cupriavidus sp. LEh21]
MSTFYPAKRRTLKLAATSLVLPAIAACGGSAEAAAPADVEAAIARFAALAPDTANCLVRAEPAGSGANAWSAGYHPDRQLFVGSAVKTFILAQFLRDAEAGRGGLSESLACDVSDTFRSPGSPVFVGLTGKTPYRNALEAMIAHSDNTGTDIALAAVGPERVRALIAEAGLAQTRIPDSTRKLFSYLAGAESGVDLGWDGMVKIQNGEDLGLKSRTDVINDKQAMLSTATEMVSWYRQSLAGKYFTQPATLTEYRRIQAMADAVWLAVPAGVQGFGKGGSIDWESFHCLCFAGQMLAGAVPVTFCLTLNWNGSQPSTERTGEFIRAVADVLGEAAKAAGV